MPLLSFCVDFRIILKTSSAVKPPSFILTKSTRCLVDLSLSLVNVMHAWISQLCFNSPSRTLSQLSHSQDPTINTSSHMSVEDDMTALNRFQVVESTIRTKNRFLYINLLLGASKTIDPLETWFVLQGPQWKLLAWFQPERQAGRSCPAVDDGKFYDRGVEEARMRKGAKKSR